MKNMTKCMATIIALVILGLLTLLWAILRALILFPMGMLQIMDCKSRPTMRWLERQTKALTKSLETSHAEISPLHG